MTILEAGERQRLSPGGLPPEAYGRPSPGPGGPPELAHEETAPPGGRAGQQGRHRGRHARLAGETAGTEPAATPVRRPARLAAFVAGAHGGAGTSTVAHLLRAHLAGSWPEGQVPRVHDKFAIPDGPPEAIAMTGMLPVPPPGTPLILVARATADGARRAVIAVSALSRCGIWPAALAVVGDGAGPEPRQASQRFTLITDRPDRCGPLIPIPFDMALRNGTAHGTGQLARPLGIAISALATAAGLAGGEVR